MKIEDETMYEVNAFLLLALVKVSFRGFHSGFFLTIDGGASH